MAKKKSIRIDFIKSCITYNKLNKIAISGIENICKRLNLDSIYDVINGKASRKHLNISTKIRKMQTECSFLET